MTDGSDGIFGWQRTEGIHDHAMENECKRKRNEASRKKDASHGME